MAYEKHTWVVGEPITQEKMNHIEDGITSASSTAETAASTASGITQVRGDVTTLQGIVGLSISDMNGLQYRVSSLEQQATQNDNGDEALSQIETATVNHIPAYDSLNQRLDSIDTSVYEESVLAQALSDSIEQAKRVNVPNDTLKSRFEYIDGRVNGLFSGYESLSQALTNAGGTDSQGLTRSLIDRLNAMDKGLVLQSGQNIPDIWNEINTARGVNNLYGSLDGRFNNIEEKISTALESTAYGKTGNNAYTSLDARFEAVEGEVVTARGSEANLDARLDTIESDISGLSSSKVSTNAIANNLTTTTEGKVLDARQGKELEDKKVNYTDIKDNLTSDDADKPLSAKQGKALKGLIDSMDTAYKAADTALDGRLDTVESDLNTASTGLKARMSTAESDIDTIESDLNTATTGLKARMTAAEGDIDSLEGIVTTPTTGLVAKVGALETTVNDSTQGLVTRVSTLETDVNHSNTGLAATKAIADEALTKANAAAVASTVNTALDNLDTRLDAIDGGTALTGANTLAQRVTSLENEPKSATEIVSVLPQTGDATKDYLLGPNEDGKYFYYKWIEDDAEDNWKLISGGGSGNGSSSGEFAASISATDIPNPNDTTDYFVGDNTNGYIHYRYVIPEGESVGNFVRILPKNLVRNVSINSNGGLVGYTVEDDSTNIFSGFNALKTVSYDVVKVNDVDTTVITFVDTNGATHTVNVVGGGGSGATQTVRLNNMLSSLNLTVPDKEGVTTILRAKAIVKDGSEIDTQFSQALNVATQYSLSQEGPWTNYTTQTVTNNVEFSVNVSNILTTGVKTYVRLVLTTVIDEQPVTRTVTYEISKVAMSISSNFNQAIVRTTNFNFSYTCIGSGLTKQVHFLIDGEDITGSPVTTTLHNDTAQQLIPITGLTAGMHSFSVYFTVDGVESNILNYYILYNNDNARIAPMVALAAENPTITYGDDLNINFTVYTPGLEQTDSVLLELFTRNGNAEAIITHQTFENVDNEKINVWKPTEYPESGTAYIRATATHTVNGTNYTDSQTIEITINALVLPEGYSLTPAGSENLVYSYNAYGRTNNDAGKETYNYDFTAITGQHINWTGAFNGFNWSGNGYVDGTALTISGGATHTVNVPIFQNRYNNILLEDNQGISDISEHGRTVEIEYEVLSATDLNDVIINYMSDITTDTTNGITTKSGTGFQVTPQSCYLLKSGSTVNTDSTGFIINESDIAAAYLTPGMRIHLAFVIEPWATELAFDRSYHQSVNIYVNGEFANTCPYVRGTDSFASTATLSIGSSSCIIKLYQIKMYNRGLTQKEILQNYKVAPSATRDKLTRLEDNDILDADGKVDYEKARTKYTCLLLTGPEPIINEGIVTNPTVSPYKGYPSPAHRTDKKTGEAVGKTESGLTLTKPNPNVTDGFDIEFDLRDTIPTDQSIEVPAYMGDRGAYVSSNNVQGTSSQKYPVHNLKVYLAKWQGPKTTTKEVALEEGEDTTGLEIVEHDGVQYKVVTETSPAEIKKVKYSLKGKDENGDDIGYAESTLCWKADYMSTDHANTFNANIADGLFTETLPGATWGSKHQNVVYGIRCLLFQKQGSKPYEFLGDGCLNNDKGNNKTYDLEREGDDKANTASQKWEFTNNSDDLGYFKTDTIFKVVGEGANAHIQAKDAFESTYPDEGDLKDAHLEPNYNHLQILLTWLSKRANYWDETDPTAKAAKKEIFRTEFTRHINLNHALTYYIFSEYIALCDNRVKNMFLRSDNVKSEIIKNRSGVNILEGNNEPDALWSNYVAADGTTDPDYIDWQNSTFAVWAPVLYDLDSCFGVENVGYIRVRYDANWDYSWNGAPQFNGYESRLWLQFADTFDTEIKAMALTLYDRADGLNYTNFYRKQITENLENISPALSNQDMLVKFDIPWSEGFINYSLAEPAKETPEYKYLQRGSRTAQKSSFMRMRSKLLSSKYGAKEFTNDAIKFRTGVPVGASGNIIGYENAEHEMVTVQDEQHTIPVYGDGDLTQTRITVKANQVMYPGVAYGDNKAPTRSLTNNGKVNADESCTIQATSAVQGNDGIFICGASALTDIGDISIFRPYQIDVGAGVNLKRLIVGSNAEGYTNSNTDRFFNLNKCVLLEEVNICNCSNVTTLDLSNNPLIKKVYATGSGATTIIFPNGGVLNTVEYSAVTGNITLRNQSSLTNFVYENAANNKYSALRKLWVENTPNVPVVDIIVKAIDKLTAGIRITGLDVDLGNDATFLETITSDLAEGKYLDSEGAFAPGSTQRPYIQGKVHINAIRASLLAKVNTMYPNLIVYNTIDANGTPNNNVITEYTITYKNYDGELLYTDHRTGQEHYIDPASWNELDIDPITQKPRLWSICPPDGIPKKPEDAQYKYSFGTYSNGTDYDRFSGWMKEDSETTPSADDFVSGNTTFIAQYPTTELQKYTVTWYDGEGGTIVHSYSNINYGIDISNYDQPEDTGAIKRARLVNSQYQVFKGWNRPVGKVTGNINVYAQWETSTIDNATSLANFDMTTLNAADIYALSQLGAQAKIRLLESNLGNNPICIPMGNDFDYTDGVNTTNLLGSSEKFVFTSSTAEAKIYDGEHNIGEVRPLAQNTDWTLAIDFKFLLNQTVYNKGREFVIASCYKEDNGNIQGFKVSLNKSSSTTDANQSVTVTWGTQSQIIDYVTVDTSVASNNTKQYSKSYRNVLVLRHRASVPDTLYVYYIAPNTLVSNNYGRDYGLAITTTTITWSNNTAIDTPLILGGNYIYENGTPRIEGNIGVDSRFPAKGIIYWGKFWDEDLGNKNCRRLAAWPHENEYFYLAGYQNNSDPSRQIIHNTNLNFVSAQAFGDRGFYTRHGFVDTNGLISWSNTYVRQFCNERIFEGLPIKYQSIFADQNGLLAKRTITSNQLINQTSSGTTTSADYFYLSAEQEVSNQIPSDTNKAAETRIGPWPWLKSSTNLTVLVDPYNSGALQEQSSPNINPFRYRFIGKYITPTAKIFYHTEDPYHSGASWTYNNQQIYVQSGDVWITNDGTAYIYYTNAEINEGVYVDIVTAGGGWKKAQIWELRTFDTSQYAGWNRFEKVDDKGELQINQFSSTYGQNDIHLLCPEFSI